jgi:hypothetical protein
LFPPKNLNDFEVNIAKDDNIDEDLLRNENLEVDAIAKSKILEKIEAYNKDLLGILDNDGKQLKIDKYTRRKILKEYENFLFHN